MDSLCIVQDNEAEMAQQIALMPQIYDNAAATIIASRSESAFDGFLHQREAFRHTKLAVKLPLHCPDEFAPSSGLRNGSIYAIQVEDEPLPEPIDHRGWTLQERYLSPRILDFGSEKITWSCFTQNRHFNQPTDGWNACYEPRTMLRYDFRLQELKFWAANPIIIPGGVSKVEFEFYNLVELYSRRKLSFPPDRILAMSGIAAGIHSIHNDWDYKVGHWAHSLQNNLLWRVSRGCHQPRPALYQAPSWSWAGVNGAIDFFYSRVSEIARENLGLEAHVKLQNESAPFGAVQDGGIAGRGTMYRALWFGEESEFRITRSTPVYALHRLVTAAERPSLSSAEEIPMLHIFPDAIEKEFASELADASGSRQAIVVHLLLFGMLTGDDDLRGPVGLVLREEADPSSASMTSHDSGSVVKKYSRVGLFGTHRKRNPQGLEGSHVDEFFENLFQRHGEERFEIL